MIELFKTGASGLDIRIQPLGRFGPRSEIKMTLHTYISLLTDLALFLSTATLTSLFQHRTRTKHAKVQVVVKVLSMVCGLKQSAAPKTSGASRVTIYQYTTPNSSSEKMVYTSSRDL